jgi:hypothetical protein
MKQCGNIITPREGLQKVMEELKVGRNIRQPACMCLLLLMMMMTTHPTTVPPPSLACRLAFGQHTALGSICRNTAAMSPQNGLRKQRHAVGRRSQLQPNTRSISTDNRLRNNYLVLLESC